MKSDTAIYSKEFVDSLFQACKDYRSQVDELERENAALQEDKERLDWLETLDCDSHWWVHIADSTNLRAAIDAARKEEQS